MNNEELDELETQIPYLAIEAFKKARMEALAAGSILIEWKDGRLVKTYPNGLTVPFDCKVDLNTLHMIDKIEDVLT